MGKTYRANDDNSKRHASRRENKIIKRRGGVGDFRDYPPRERGEFVAFRVRGYSPFNDSAKYHESFA